MAETAEKSGAAGSRTFSGSDSRRYNYFEPEGRRATLYEDVTVDVQPDPARHLLQGWIISFANGLGAYSETASAARCSDWHLFRAPDQEWSRTHYQRQSHIENTIKMVVDNARAAGSPSRFDKTWVTILEQHLGALKHAEFGLGVALTKAQRNGMTQMVNNTLLTNSSYKLRLAQDITLYLGDIGLDIEVDGDAGKKTWLTDPAWQPARKVIEAILSGTDHIEVYFATNIVFEALVGELFRGGFIMRAGPLHNDFVTPSILSAAESDYRRNLANTLTLMKLLTSDPEHADANKKLMTAWLEKYVPMCADAARSLAPIWQLQVNGDLTFESVYADARARFNDILAECDATMPAGVML